MTVIAGMPNGAATVPDGFGNATVAIDFDQEWPAQSRTRSCSCLMVQRMTSTEAGTAELFTWRGPETCTAHAQSLCTEQQEESEDGAFWPVREGQNGFNNEQE